MEKLHDQFYDLEYDERNALQAGEDRGVGMPGKVGSHRDGTDGELETKGKITQVPPLQFN